MLDIEKLCEEFHEKIGKDKTIKITIEEGDTEDTSEWFTGTLRPDVWDKIKNRTKTEKPKPFIKLSKGNGIEYSYICFKQEEKL